MDGFPDQQVPRGDFRVSDSLERVGKKITAPHSEFDIICRELFFVVTGVAALFCFCSFFPLCCVLCVVVCCLV